MEQIKQMSSVSYALLYSLWQTFYIVIRFGEFFKNSSILIKMYLQWQYFPENSLLNLNFQVTYIRYGLSVDYKREKKYINYYVTTWIAIAIVLSTYSIVIYQKYYSFSYITFAYVYILLVSGMYGSIFSIFSFLLYNVKIRFKLLNRSLR